MTTLELWVRVIEALQPPPQATLAIGEVLIGCIDCNRWGYPGDT
jgi:hypothetical protein